MKPVSFLYNKVRLILMWRTTEYFLVSYPKCGRTWIRVFLAKYFSLITSKEIDPEFPFLFRPDKSVPQLFFTHFGWRGQVVKKSQRSILDLQLDDLKQNIIDLNNKNIVFIARDPRDAIVSLYFYMGRKSKDEEVSKMDLTEFIRHPQYGIQYAVAYMNLWLQNAHHFSSFTIIKYEDLKTDPAVAFTNLLQAIGVSTLDQEAFDAALEYSDFKNIQKLEKKNQLNHRLFPEVNTKDAESLHARKGKVHGYAEYCSDEDIEYLSAEMKRLDPAFGYSI